MDWIVALVVWIVTAILMMVGIIAAIFLIWIDITGANAISLIWVATAAITVVAALILIWILTRLHSLLTRIDFEAALSCCWSHYLEQVHGSCCCCCAYLWYLFC